MKYKKLNSKEADLLWDRERFDQEQEREKVYRGRRFNPDDPLSKAIVTVNGRPLKHIVRHSPTGLNWGYGGSGPADTALSVLTDIFEGNVELADIFYFDFKWDFVSTWNDQWQITEAEIEDWLRVRSGKGIQDLIQEFKTLERRKARTEIH